MSDIPIPSFAALVVRPGERVRVALRESVWCVTSASLAPDDAPAGGRVVLYAATVGEDGRVGERIAIAPLTVGRCEVASLDYAINSYAPVVFSTEGAAVAVTVSGYTTSAEQLQTEVLSEK